MKKKWKIAAAGLIILLLFLIFFGPRLWEIYELVRSLQTAPGYRINCPSGYVLMKIIKMQKNQRKSKMLNEHLFYGGIFLCACSVGLAVILGSLYTIQKIRLNSKLNEEYGKEIKGK